MKPSEQPPKDEPAFPGIAQHSTRDDIHEGMSLLDWFAGQALAGLCSNPGGPFQANAMNGWGIVNCTPENVAIECYSLAREMLKERLNQ